MSVCVCVLVCVSVYVCLCVSVCVSVCMCVCMHLNRIQKDQPSYAVKCKLTKMILIILTNKDSFLLGGVFWKLFTEDLGL